MTRAEADSLTPLIDSLQKSGFIASHALASWPGGKDRETGESIYDYWYRLSVPRLHNALVVSKPASEADIRFLEQKAWVRQTFGPAIQARLNQVAEEIVTELSVDPAFNGGQVWWPDFTIDLARVDETGATNSATEEAGP